eukprot:3749426-Prymnesium_polylepis.1
MTRANRFSMSATTRRRNTCFAGIKKRTQPMSTVRRVSCERRMERGSQRVGEGGSKRCVQSAAGTFAPQTPPTSTTRP